MHIVAGYREDGHVSNCCRCHQLLWCRRSATHTCAIRRTLHGPCCRYLQFGALRNIDQVVTALPRSEITISSCAILLTLVTDIHHAPLFILGVESGAAPPAVSCGHEMPCGLWPQQFLVLDSDAACLAAILQSAHAHCLSLCPGTAELESAMQRILSTLHEIIPERCNMAVLQVICAIDRLSFFLIINVSCGRAHGWTDNSYSGFLLDGRYRS